jgi:large subunit ribosomal protein L21
MQDFPLSRQGFSSILMGLALAMGSQARPMDCRPCAPTKEVFMFAIIKTGGKQYRVAEGDVLRVETLEKDPKQTFTFDQVLLIDNDGDLKVGQPTVSGATVEAEVITHDRAKKVIIFKKKKTTTYQRTQGHRQGFTEVRIKAIKA